MKKGQASMLKGIKCNTCKSTSWNQKDVEQKYCGKCNKFHLGESDYEIFSNAGDGGKYNHIADWLMDELKARSLLLLVLDGAEGHGVTMKVRPEDAGMLASVLEGVLHDMRQGGAKCPHCDFVISMPIGPTEQAKPIKGAMCVCMECGELSVYNAELELDEIDQATIEKMLPPKNLKQLQLVQSAIKKKTKRRQKPDQN